MEEVVKDIKGYIKGSIVLNEAAIKKLEKCKRHLANRETHVDMQGLEEVCELIESAIGDLKEALNDEYFKKLKAINRDKKNKTFKSLANVENYKVIPDGEYYMEEFRHDFGKVDGIMRVKDGTFIVEIGSKCAPVVGSRCPKARKNAKIENNVLMEDVVCKSPSTAGEILMGKPVNGWTLWKTAGDKPIDIYRKNGGIVKWKK